MSPSDGLTIVGFAITLGVAIVGWVWLRRGDRRTVEALRLAQSAEDRAQRLEDQALESRDVRWVHRDVGDAQTVSLHNAGSDTAYDVVLIVESIDDDFPRRENRFSSIGPGDRAGMKLAAEARERNEEWKAMAADGVLGGIGLHLRVRVTWKSASGVPAHQEFDDLVI